MNELLARWVAMGNNYGTEEGGWTEKADAEAAIEALVQHGYNRSELVILGKINDEEGWETLGDDQKYSHFCITDDSGENILQPGVWLEEDDKTEQGVNRLGPPNGWTWAFVA